MEVRSCRHVAVAVAIGSLVACDGDGSDGLDSGSPSGSTSMANAEATLADLDRLIADADAYRFVAGLLRTEGSLSTVNGIDTDFVTDLAGGFERATDGDMAALLGETRESLVELTTVGCRIDGEYADVVFDDVPDDDEADSAFSEYVSAGDTLAVSDETRALGALIPFDDPDGEPYYEWEAPDGTDDVGTLSVDVPGDVFPGVGTVTVPMASLEGLAVDTPLALDAEVRWDPVDDAGRFLVAFVVEGDEEGGVYIECVTSDDGSFRLPDATLARLPEGLDEVSFIEIERAAFDIVPMGEAVVLTARYTSTTIFGDE